MLNHDQICQLIPHADDMCLLDQVKSWDDKKIICTSMTHTKADNPLRNEDGLPMVSLLEYGAQAMAVHGCLLSNKDDHVIEEGYLAALRDVKIADGSLSDITSELEIEAEQVFSDAGNMIYTLRIYTNTIMLASGRATVIARFG